MKKTRHTPPPEQIIRKPREAEARLAAGISVPERGVARDLGISEATFHRWKDRYGAMNADSPPSTCESWKRRTPASRRSWPSRRWT